LNDVARYEGWTSSRGAASNWMVKQTRSNFQDFVFAFHDDEEIGPRTLARIARSTGLRPEDL
jgi:hypothetical protein